MTDLSQYSDADIAQMAGIQMPQQQTNLNPMMPNLIKAESGGDPDALSPKGAAGKFQIMPATARDPGYGVKPLQGWDGKDPRTAPIEEQQRFANDYLNAMQNHFGGNANAAAAAYNAGPGRVGSGQPLPKETQNYVPKVVGKQYAQNNTTATDTTDNAPDLSQYSDADIAKMAGISIQQPQKNQTTPFSTKAQQFLADIGTSLPGRVVGSSVDAAHDIIGNLVGMFTGKNVPEQTPHPETDLLAKQGFSKTSWPDIVGAGEEALFNSPTGQLLRLGGASPQGMVMGSTLGKGNEIAENELGIPQQYSTAAEMALPFLFRSNVVDRTQNLAKNDDSGPFGGGGNSPQSLREMLSNLYQDIKAPTEEQAKTQEINNKINTGAGGQSMNLAPKDINAAQELLTNILSQDKINPSEVADKLESSQKISPDLTALDVATKTVPTSEGDMVVNGKQLMATAKAFANMPGEGASMAGEVAARGAPQAVSARMTKYLDDYLSKTKFYDAKDDLDEQMASSKDIYGPAFEANKSMDSPILRQISNTPAGRQALKNAVTTMQNDRTAIGVHDPDLVEQAALAGQDLPDGVVNGLKLRTWDQVKQELWDLGQAAREKNDYGAMKDTTASRAIKKQMYDLINELDNLDSTNKMKMSVTGDKVPDPGTGLYAQARAAYKEPARIASALAKGRNFAKMDPEEIDNFFNKDEDVTDAEKNAFSIGARRALRYDSNPTRLWKQQTMDRLQPMAKDDEAFNTLSQKMEHELAMACTNNNYNAGSPTAPNQAFGKTSEGIVGKTVKGLTNPQGALMDAGINVLDRTIQQKLQASPPNVRAAVIRYLTTKDPEVWRDLATKMPSK